MADKEDDLLIQAEYACLDYALLDLSRKALLHRPEATYDSAKYHETDAKARDQCEKATSLMTELLGTYYTAMRIVRCYPDALENSNFPVSKDRKRLLKTGFVDSRARLLMVMEFFALWYCAKGDPEIMKLYKIKCKEGYEDSARHIEELIDALKKLPIPIGTRPVAKDDHLSNHIVKMETYNFNIGTFNGTVGPNGQIGSQTINQNDLSEISKLLIEFVNDNRIELEQDLSPEKLAELNETEEALKTEKEPSKIKKAAKKAWNIVQEVGSLGSNGLTIYSTLKSLGVF
ncbi:MAG: hypothetical protein HGB19_09815 [Chlorobiales bacterium]|nr:hypothetical protein [Chlorobiales bacterium]